MIWISSLSRWCSTSIWRQRIILAIMPYSPSSPLCCQHTTPPWVTCLHRVYSCPLNGTEYFISYFFRNATSFATSLLAVLVVLFVSAILFTGSLRMNSTANIASAGLNTLFTATMINAVLQHIIRWTPWLTTFGFVWLVKMLILVYIHAQWMMLSAHFCACMAIGWRWLRIVVMCSKHFLWWRCSWPLLPSVPLVE